MDQKTSIKALIIATCAYYRERLDDHVVEMYAEDLLPLGLAKITEAIRAIRRDHKVTRFPLPAKIYEIACPANSDDSVASTLAANIIRCSGRYGNVWANGFRHQGQSVFEGSGHYHRTFEDAVKAEIGTLGLAVIGHWGGWRRLCDYCTGTEKGIVFAQLNKFILGIMQQARLGTLGTPPELPGPSRVSLAAGSGLEPAGDVLNAIRPGLLDPKK